MASLASINVKFNVDLSDFSSQMQNSLRSIDKWGQKLQSVGRSLSVAVTLPVVAAGFAAKKMASDYQESVNKVDVSFKQASGVVEDFSETTLEASGIAAGTALDMASAYGDMATSMGLPVTAAAKMSTSLVTLAGDLASFKNISLDVANTAISSIFTGETESLKKLGIVMTEANLQNYAYSQGIKVKVNAMDQASKVQLRYNYIMSVTKNSQGDFARTQGNEANQSRILTESLKQLGQQLGSIILPLYTKVITSINSGIKSFSNLSEGTKTVIVVVAGLAAAIGPLLFGIGAILALVPSVVAGFAAVKAAVIGFQSSLVTVAAALAVAFALYEIFSTANQKAAASVKELSNAQKLQKQITDDATNSITAQKAELASFLAIANDETKSKKERLAAIKEINKISPEYLGNLNLENIGTDKARIAIEKYNEALLKGAKAKAAQQVLQELYKKEIETAIQREKAEANKNKLLEEANKKQFTSAAAQKQYNDLLNDKSGVLKTLREQEDKDVKSQIAVAAKIYNQGKDYLDLLKETGAQAQYNSSLNKEDKTKRPDIEALPDVSAALGTVGQYDAQIEGLKAFAKALNIDPSNLISTTYTVEEMTQRITDAMVNSTVTIDAEQQKMVANATSFNEQFSAVWQNTIGGFAENFGALIGQFALGGASLANVGNIFLTSLADMAIQVGKIAISVGIAVLGIKKALQSLNPVVAIAAGVALIALGTIAKSSLADASGGNTPKFANGGIVGGTSYYGDKILARVNSKELIANTDQQKAIWGAMNAGSSQVIPFIPELKVKGSDLIVVFNRAMERKNRIG